MCIPTERVRSGGGPPGGRVRRPGRLARRRRAGDSTPCVWGSRLGQVRIFQNLIKNLPARAARKNLSKFACAQEELERRLDNPSYPCRHEDIGGISRDSCRWPFTCCSTWRPEWTKNEWGSPRRNEGPTDDESSPPSRANAVVRKTSPSRLRSVGSARRQWQSEG